MDPLAGNAGGIARNEMTLIWDTKGRQRVLGTTEEPTMRLKVLTAAPAARPISIAVVAGRPRRPGELGWARLQRQPRRVRRCQRRGLRLLLEDTIARYWLWWALGVLMLTGALALVIGLAVEVAWVLGALWAGLRGLLGAVGLASVLLGAGGHGAGLAVRWPVVDARPAVVRVADLVWDRRGAKHEDLCLACSDYE